VSKPTGVEGDGVGGDGVEGVLISGVYETAAAMPLRVVRLDVPVDEIRRRLLADPTTGRREDLEVAEEWLAGSIGLGFEDFTVTNVGPIDGVTTRILEWLGWTR
jgi:hypothetical protein